MPITKEILDYVLVTPGSEARLDKRETGWAFAEELKDYGKEAVRERAREILDRDLAELTEAQDILYAARSRSVLVILQAMDAGGKDGTIKHVMSGINPQGCRVHSFKQPSAEEAAHDFLWRYASKVPAAGMIGIFNRSHYEEVLVVRVHPEHLGNRRPKGNRKKTFWKKRFQSINNFERHLVRNGTVVLKFFLHISKEEQKNRLLARLDDPAKHWKFSAADLAERSRWNDYMDAFEDAITATSTQWAPWYVVPADHKWVARTIVASVLARAIRDLDLAYPKLSAEQEAALTVARRKLEAE